LKPYAAVAYTFVPTPIPGEGNWETGDGHERGEVAEWFKAAVLKTVERKLRGFESLPLRPIPNNDPASNLARRHPDHGKVPEWSNGAAC
jgi:hypothetical protein